MKSLKFQHSSLPIIVTLGLFFHTQHDKSACAKKEDTKAPKKYDSVSLYLKPESREVLVDFFDKRKTSIAKDKTNLVCIGSELDDKSVFVYQPLFGERAAFRLKGIIETKDGDIVGVGRVSTMIGEIKHDGYDVSLPIPANTSPNSLLVLADLPTRLNNSNVTAGKTFWQGRIAPGKVGDRKYSTMSGAKYTELPVDKQVIVDGYICSDRYVDENGHCLFDRSTIESVMNNDGVDVNDSSIKLETATANATEQLEVSVDNNGNDVEAEPECPVCKYMKAGPCGEAFLTWDACVTNVKDDENISKCFDVTAAMMRCMKTHEYYDILTAGMDFSKLDATEQNKQSVSNKDDKKHP